MITGKSNIGNKLSQSTENAYRTFNSLKGAENDWEIFEATKEEINEALILASSVSAAYAKTSYDKRAAFLKAIAHNLEVNRSELTRIFCLESSLPLDRANSELDRTILQLNLFAEYILSDTFPEVVKHKGTNDLRKTYFPLGPIVVFGSSNFPFAYSTIGGDSASALAAGCPVVVKSHPMHAGIGELIAQQVLEAAKATGMPDGIFSNLNIRSHESGGYLIKHPHVKGVGFTGSLRGGRALFDIAQQREVPIPFFAEMGSLNPVCIHPSAFGNRREIEQWASKYAVSIATGAGQFCTKPGLIISVKGDALEEFKQVLIRELEKLGSHAMLHPDLFSGFMKGVEQTSENVRVETLSGNISETASSVNSILFNCDAEYFINNPDLQHEMFGPASMIIACEDVKQMKEALSVLSGQLTGTLLYEGEAGADVKELFELIQARVGRIIINGVPTGVEVCEAMNHGGPYPATTDERFTAVGTNSIRRWLRPVVFQNVPEELLPPELI